MDSGHSSGQRGKGGKGRGDNRLGLKVTHSPTPLAPPAASFSSPPLTILFAPPGPPSSSLAPRAPTAVEVVPASSPAPSTVVSSSSPVGRASSPLQGNQRAPNLWMKAKRMGFSSISTWNGGNLEAKPNEGEASLAPDTILNRSLRRLAPDPRHPLPPTDRPSAVHFHPRFSLSPRDGVLAGGTRRGANGCGRRPPAHGGSGPGRARPVQHAAFPAVLLV
ncbi:hypothetical protein GUJ93_ZPchr0002g25000 [Zizania palustris]|uniref:Uncharacterized protein n=1 Tax=Zizania palustris TaxID=103762 RepID=A0A8J5VED8_ZIZPA|nr:hypothetical protein GUJ93_ZPchr0002g25000 [Zizania palustris]